MIDICMPGAINSPDRLAYTGRREGMPRERQDDEAFTCEICWHYYINKKTQAEIADMLGVTRLRVNQAIQRARAIGMVQVQIDSPFLPRIKMQAELRERYGLREVVVAPADRDKYDHHVTVGAALAMYLNEVLRSDPWRSLGVSWGLTLEAAINALPKQSHPDLEIVSMLGGTTKGASFNAFSIASSFATSLGAKYSTLAAPIFLSEDVDRDAFLSQEIFREHFAKFESLDAAILTASDVSPLSFLVAYGLPSNVTAEDLVAAGAVGDVLGRYLDKDGNAVAHPIDDRTIGASLEKVAKIPNKILVAAGPHKVPIMRIAMARGLVDTLVTDDVTGELLLQAVAGEAASHRATNMISARVNLA